MRIALILVLISSLSFVAANVQASDYKSNFRHIPAIETGPIRVAVWKRTPTVIVCEHAPVKESQIKEAVKFWRNLGHKFMRTQYKYDPLGKCNSGAPLGYILVHLVTQNIKLDSDSLAETHFFIDNDTNEVDWAIIYMRSITKDIVLEHEVGHALGYLHFNKINHLMNSKWTQGGWETSGLENRR
jgi:hypothetical protein